MYSVRLVQLLLVALGFIAVAQATFLNYDNTGPDAALRIRQDEESTPSPSGGSQPSPSPSDGGSDPSPSPSDPGEQDETTTTTDGTTTTAPPTTTPPTTTNDPEPTPSPSESVPEPSDRETTQGSDEETTTTRSDEETTTSERRSTLTSIIVVTTTDGEGRTTEITSASEYVSTPSLSASDDDNGGGGMPEGTRNIVIGVVCGVGGAIILGALGFVAWRVWGRKKKAEENDGLMDYHTAGTSAFSNEPKPDAMSNSTGPSRSPFQTTLEDYHRPGQVNASSNF